MPIFFIFFHRNGWAAIPKVSQNFPSCLFFNWIYVLSFPHLKLRQAEADIPFNA